MPSRSLSVLRCDSRFIPEVLNILILSRWSPGCYRLNRGVAEALPGSDADIALLSAGVVTVYRGSAGTLPAFTGDQPGHFLRQPVHCRGFTGINQSGVDRDSAGLLTGFNRGGTGK
ncbi:hypothetical protein DPMN_131045 [Dreissena polymorpha]|uniref:Uncharacterized protein n=1 Tax=Dreissena polymorpha TaxID=45954 RepID=A0A9D4HU03_DREPO|nr:hypothetical protein DPMN_056962 [Dreissena polymorpha]KAH3829057.1 hypothetical protein DPMN_131045 [Dreissena polymorpha]